LVLTATQSWFPSASTAYNGTSWAVSTLFFFYAVFPAFVAWSKRLDQRRLWTALCATWMMVLLPAVVVLVTEEGRRPPQGSIEYWLLHSLPVGRLAEFLFGVVLCKLYLRGGGVRRVNGTLLSAGALTALLLVLARSRELPYALLHNGLVTPLHAMIILGVASGRGGLTWVLSHPKMRVLGDASLSLYLLHVPFLYWGLFLVKKVTPLDSVSGEAAFLAGYAVLCIGASILTTRFIVDPVAVFLKDRLPGAFSGWRRRLGFLAPAMLRRRRTPERPERLLYKG
ncbi:MAG: acyltransferase family protein, partial [Gemmatimonadota bacterium]|nr:acyltransferase family protein [Gemmatimonadota bacterium]